MKATKNVIISIGILGLILTNCSIRPTSTAPTNTSLSENTTPSVGDVPDIEPLAYLDGPRILFQSNRDGDFSWFTMRSDGSDVSRLTLNFLQSYRVNRLKWVSPLKVLMVSLVETNGQEDMYLIDLEGRILHRLTNDFLGEGEPMYSPESGLFAFECVKFDLDICTVTSEGTNMVNLTMSPSRDGDPHWSRDGKTILFISNRAGVPGLWLVNLDGSNLHTYSEGIAAPEERPMWSPDGSRILFQSQRDGNWEIYTINADGTNPTRLTNNPAPDVNPIWSPNGQWIAFRSERQGQDIYVMRADGTGLINLTGTPEVKERSFLWGLDSEQIFYVTIVDGQKEIFVISVDGSNKTNLTSHPADDQDIQWIGN